MCFLLFPGYLIQSRGRVCPWNLGQCAVTWTYRINRDKLVRSYTDAFFSTKLILFPFPSSPPPGQSFFLLPYFRLALPRALLARGDLNLTFVVYIKRSTFWYIHPSSLSFWVLLSRKLSPPPQLMPFCCTLYSRTRFAVGPYQMNVVTHTGEPIAIAARRLRSLTDT